jgi:ABC-type polysaccharide transport system permease subunit
MDFESIWYEYTPYLYAIAGIMSILHIGSIIGTSFGLALLVAAGFIIRVRHNYRKAQSDRTKRHVESFQ